MTPITTYRFKFASNIMGMLTQFAKLHQFDDRKTYKAAWEVWVEENREELNVESERLIGLNYRGDINDKMYKAARYYFRKKSGFKKDPKLRRTYIPVSTDCLEAMDQHVTNHIKDEDYSPATGYSNFCQENIELLKHEIQLICEDNSICAEDIRTKIKKTYKNRYFMFTKRL